MNPKELYLEMNRVIAECQFVANCTLMTSDTRNVYVELVGELTQYLPPNRCTLVIEQSRFSVAVVRDVYEFTVAIWLQEAADKAADLARVPPKKKG